MGGFERKMPAFQKSVYNRWGGRCSGSRGMYNASIALCQQIPGGNHAARPEEHPSFFFPVIQQKRMHSSAT